MGFKNCLAGRPAVGLQGEKPPCLGQRVLLEVEIPAIFCAVYIIPPTADGYLTAAAEACLLYTSIDDFIISYFTSSGVQNLSIYVYSSAKRGIEPTVYALSTLMFVTVLTLLLILNRRSAHERSAAKV